MLIKPIITEKSMQLASVKKYTFKVQPDANKTEIKSIVEKMFGVNVVSIKTITTHGKTHRKGKRFTIVSEPNWKKAIVEVKKDQKIDLFDTAGGK